MRIGREWWSLEAKPGWSVVQDPECLTLTKSDQGAFQISAARRPDTPASLEELRKAAEREAGVMGKPIPVALGGFRGFSVSYEKEGTFWRRYWISKGRLWVFATYNGSPRVRSAEEPEVEEMLATLRANNGAA
jgi:hypothetical protein